MRKITKAYNLKIILLAIGVFFIFSGMLYSYPVSKDYILLRVPIDGSAQKRILAIKQIRDIEQRQFIFERVKRFTPEQLIYRLKALHNKAISLKQSNLPGIIYLLNHAMSNALIEKTMLGNSDVKPENPYELLSMSHAKRMLLEEHIQTRLPGGPETIGIMEPTIMKLVSSRISKWREQPEFVSLCLGSLTPHTAQEFIALSHKIHPNAKPIVIDIEDYILHQLHKLDETNIIMQADAYSLPFKAEKIDLIVGDTLLVYILMNENIQDYDKRGDRVKELLENLIKNCALVLSNNGQVILTEAGMRPPEGNFVDIIAKKYGLSSGGVILDPETYKNRADIGKVEVDGTGLEGVELMPEQGKFILHFEKDTRYTEPLMAFEIESQLLTSESL